MSLEKKNGKNRKIKKVYSEEWKRDKIRLLEQGKVRVIDLVRTYGVSDASIYNWKKKYGTLPATEKVVVELDSDYLKCVSLEKQLKEHENIIGRMHIQLEYFKGIVSEINKLYDIDAEKKFG